MGKPAFPHIEKLFHEALAQSPSRRAAFLDKACAGDAALRAAVEDLLRNVETDQKTESSLVSPVAAAAAHFRAEAPVFPAHKADRHPESVPLLQGIPGYELLEELGRGGMGVVYQARQISLGRIVALKMLLPEDPAVPELLARFRTEVEALARLHHPNIITIYDIGEYEGRPYFTMEYIAGPSLDRLLQGRPQDVAASARLVETLARTMHAVHQQGIIHRDLKPANILLQIADGRWQVADRIHNVLDSSDSLNLQSAIPKITDFGLAKDQVAVTRVTQTGLTMGTPKYMAPEQARTTHDAVGPATDIYALGSILYEMLTGRPPFEGETPVEVLTQLTNDEPLSPMRLRPKLPRDLVTICLKCLEKPCNKRYATALDLAEDLRRFQAGEPIRARAVRWPGRTWRWCRRRPLVSGLIVLSSLLVVTLVVTVLVYDIKLTKALAKAEITTEEQRRQIVHLNITIGVGEVDMGDHFTALLHFTEALRLDDLDQEPEHRARIATLLRQCPRLLHLRIDDRPILCTRSSAGGGWLAALGPGNTIEVKEALTGRAVGPVLAPGSAPLGGSISPDGHSMATITADGKTRVWDLASGKSRELPGLENQAVRQTAFPSEGRILLTRHVDSAIRLWDLAAKQLDLPPSLGEGAIQFAALSENANRLFTVNSTHVGQLWDVATGQAVGAELKLPHDVSHGALSPDGGRIALLGTDRVLRIWDVKASHWLSNPIVPMEGVSRIEFSPDAERITTSGDQGIQVWQVGTGKQLFSQQGLAITHAGYSPDSRFAVTAGLGGARVWDVVSGRSMTPPLRHGGPLASAAFDASGKQIITISRRGTVAVWQLPGLDEMRQDPDSISRMPVAALVTLAQVLARGRIDERQDVQTLPEDSLPGLMSSLASTGYGGNARGPGPSR